MKKLIYILVALAVIAAIWEVFNATKPAVAPTASNAVPTSTSNPAPLSGTNVVSGFFSERTNPTIGTYLTDGQGMTLYTFTHDTADVSNCTGACLSKWPPYGPGLSATGTEPVNLPMIPAGFSTIKGNNGMLQFTWQGHPLYHYFEDKVPGDVLGQGVLNAWYAVKQ